MIDRSRLRGIVPPIVTPLLADGETVNQDSVHHLIGALIDQGVHGIFVGGTTGEVWALDDVQWTNLVQSAVAACKGRVPLYAGVSSSSTGKAVRRARKAEELGADVVVSLTPHYVPSAQEDVVRHFEKLAAVTSLPVIVYQFPMIVKISITLDTYARLMQIPGVVGIKDSQADVTEFRRMVEVLRGDGQDARLFLGSDALTDVTVMLGGQGTVPTLGNIAAKDLVETYEAAVAGDWTRSKAAQEKANRLKRVYAPAMRVSFFRGVFAGVKCALNLMGFEVGPTAAPMAPCDAEETRAIREILCEEGVL